MNKIFHKFLRTVFFVIMIVTIFCVTLYAEDVYYPYPIIFVHGIASNNDMWVTMRDELRQNFKYGIANYGVEEYKYPSQISEYNYFTGCDYRNNNNGKIEDIARDTLKASIEEALSYYPSFIPKSERKVTIVCHSMGGLVVRSLLYQMPSYKDKIHRVVFIDTPHLGSPYASIVWLLNEVRDGRYNTTKPDINYFKLSAFSVFEGLGNVVATESACIAGGIKNTQLHINLLLKPLDVAARKNIAPDPKGIAISQLRIPAPAYYSITYKGLRGIFNATVTAGYSGGDSFLGSAYLDKPKDFKVIIGKNTSGWQKGLWSLDKLINFSDNFTFPTLFGEKQSIENAIFTGDGIVTKSSQEGIGAADYSVGGFHVGVTDNPDCIKSVINALDDPPEIERVYAVPCDWNARWYDDYYIVIKAKEYLLADLEIESITLNGESGCIKNLNEFYDAHSKAYKPYFKFGKEFLTKRQDPNIRDKNGNIISLEPGEFYVRAALPRGGYGSPPVYVYDQTSVLDVTLKNPAGKTKKETIQICRPKANMTFDNGVIDVPPYYSDGGMPCSTALTHLYIYSGGSSKMYAKVGVSEYSSDMPFVTLKEGDIFLQYNGDFYEADLTNYASWSGSNGRGGTVPEQCDYRFHVSLYPEDMSAMPSKGDNKMDVPVSISNYLDIVRADPTFIQTHRSYSHLAKYDTLRRFEQYGYSIDPAYFNPSGFNETDKTVLQKIDSAISGIVDIEESFSIEKAKIMARARALSQNQPSDPLKDKASADLIGELAKSKETRVCAVMDDINGFASTALVMKASLATPASCAWTE